MTALGASPVVCENGLLKDFDAAKKAAFLKAIDYVVDKNPLLGGRLVALEGRVYVETGTFHKTFCTQVRTPKNLPPMTPTIHKDPRAMLRLLNTIDDECFPESPMGADQIQQNLPLFHVYLVELKHGYAAYSLRMSHYLGDVATKNLVENQLWAYMQDELQQQDGSHSQGKTSKTRVPDIDWKEDTMCSVEEFLEYKTKKHAKNTTLWDRLASPFAMMWPVIYSLLFPYKRIHEIVLSCDKIQEAKDRFSKEPEVSSLTTTDIIWAALARSSVNVKLLLTVMNQRGERSGVFKEQEAGNLMLNRILFGQAAQDPKAVHSSLRMTHEQHFEPGSIPWWPLMTGNFLVVSSWRNLNQRKLPPWVVCKSVPRTFFTCTPLAEGMVVVHQMDDKHIVVKHMKRFIDAKNGLLGELLA